MEGHEDRIKVMYEEATRAAGAGQWDAAAVFLERCCNLQRFESSVLNSQWMVAADHCEKSYDLGTKAFALAKRAWQAGSTAGSLEFLQAAMYRGCHDPETAVQVNHCAHEWPIAAVRNSRPLPLQLPERLPERFRIGHLVGLLNPTHAPTKLIRALTDEIATEAADSHIYTTEWAASWFHNWNHPRQSGPEEFLSNIRKARVHIHEAHDNFLARANTLAARIRQDDLDVLVVHASMSEMVTALVALLRPARRLISVNHASEMDLPCFDGAIHMFENGKRRTRLEIPSVVIPPASDMDVRLKQAARLSKSQLQIPQQATVSGTFGNLYKIENPEFLESLRCILEHHPNHFHLIAGAGNDRAIKKFLEEAGISSRVRLLGPRTDIPSLLLLLDFYLASHPYPGALSEIEAMAAACPVISVRNHPESHYNAGAESVGISECIVDPKDTNAMVALASRYLGDPTWSRTIGQKLKCRFEQVFAPSRVAAHHLQFYQSFSNPTGENLS